MGNSGSKEYFMKVYPTLWDLNVLLGKNGRMVLDAFMRKITLYFHQGSDLSMTYRLAYNTLKKHLGEKAVEKFTQPRYSDGIKELVDLGIIYRVPYANNVYRYNKRLFNLNSNRTPLEENEEEPKEIYD